MDKKVKLRVQGLTNSQIQSGAYALILAEENGLRRIPIIVGTAEAQSIAIALEHIIPPRPLTHDLFTAFSRAFDITLKEVFIYKFDDGVYYSELVFGDEERQVRLDSRTSDAIAIALRLSCDIFTTEEIVRECGVVLEESGFQTEEEEDDIEDAYADDDAEPEDFEDTESMNQWLQRMEQEDLEDRLEEAIGEENYENAQLYKNEIARRQNKQSNN